MNERKQLIEGTLYRDFAIRKNAVVDEDERTVRVSASSEEPVLRKSFFSEPWYEVLGHQEDEVNLSRLKNGASVHYNHSRTRADRIGVVESAEVRGSRVEAVVRISKRPDVEDVWTDIRDGVLTNISVGYTIDERTLTREGDGKPDEYRITSWTPLEVSFVDIPADPTVGVGRNESGEFEYRVIDLVRSDQPMNDQVTNMDAAVNEGVKQERVRVATINQVFAAFPQHESVRAACISEGVDIAESRKRLLTELGRNVTPAQTGDASRHGEFADDAHFAAGDRGDGFVTAASDAICLRSNVPVEKPHDGARDLRGCSTNEVAKLCLGRRGVNTSRLSKTELFSRAMTSSDFPLILQNAASKSTINGYNEAPGTHRSITSQIFVPDFKTAYRVAAGEAPDLALVSEDGEFTYGALTETGASVALATYGRLAAVSRQTLINDDIGEVLRALRSFGAAAARLEANLVYGQLVSNPTMQDGDTLFHANHSNIATAAVPSVTSLGEMRTLLRKQKGIGGDAYLDLQPYAIVAPVAMETQLEQLLSSLFDPFPASGTSDSAARNPFANKLELIVDPRLDDDSTTRWYLITNPNVFNWFDRVHLEGQPTPFFDEQNGWSIDGTEFKVRHDFATVINEYRGIVKNDGV